MEKTKKNTDNRFGRWLQKCKNHPFSGLAEALVWLSGIMTMAIMIYLVAFIVIHGVPHLKPSLFSLTYNSDNVSLMPALVNTLIITALSLVIAIPFGVFAAIYLVEYAKRGNKFVKIIRLTTETLSGIPSIVYGLFGMLFFVSTMILK